MLPEGTTIEPGDYLIEAGEEEPESEGTLSDGEEAPEPLAWRWRGRRSRIKWKKSLCYRIYFIDRNTHWESCIYAGEAGPYDYVMENRHQIRGHCLHRNCRPLNYCDELIFTCLHCGKPRHYRWTYFHERKLKW